MDTTKDETTFTEDSVNTDTTFATSESNTSTGIEEDCTSMQKDDEANALCESAEKDYRNPNKKTAGKKSPNIGVRVGILIGGITSLFVNLDSDEAVADNKAATDNTIKDTTTKVETPKQESPEDAPTAKEETTRPEWADDALQVSKTVNDGMTFNEAFAAARAESGAGATFEWRGKIYGTYTAEEWDNMTNENRAEFANHFAWDNIDVESSDVAQYSDAIGNGDSVESAATSDDDIEIVSVQHPLASDATDNNVNGDMLQDSDEVEVTAVKFDSSMSSEVDTAGMTGSNETAYLQNEDIIITPDENEDSIIPDGLDRLTTPPGDLYAFNDTADL